MPVHLVPAGWEGFSNNYFAAISTYNSKKIVKEHETTSFSYRKRKWTLKDRVLEQRSFNYTDPYQIDDIYNLYTPILGPFYLKQNNFKYVLMNIPQGEKIPYNFYKEFPDIKTFVDSGGFQLFTGKKDFIDPVKLAETYNAIANIGVDLDIPCDNSQITRPYLEACAKIQKANYEIISQNIDKNVDILRVSHGKNLEYRKIFMDILAPENPKYFSVAGAVVGLQEPKKTFLIAEAILYFLSQFKTIEYIHCLGYTSSRAWVVYSLIEQLGLVKNIGGDAVSFFINSASGFFHFPIRGGMQISRRLSISTPSPCTCPVCRNVKDLRLLNSTTLLQAHNLYQLNKKKDFIYAMVKELLSENIRYADFLKETGVTLDQKQLHALVDYVQDVKANKFREFSKVKSHSLFENVPHSMSSELMTKYNGIIKKYEKYYQKRFL